MKIKERLVVLETKLIYIERLIYVVLTATAAQVGIEFIPL